MKKITLLVGFIALLLTSIQIKAQIYQEANWPNANWTISNPNLFTATGFASDPTTTANFSFDDNAAGAGSLFDIIHASSPIINLNPALTATPNPHLELIVTVDYVFNQSGDVLTLEWWDQSTHLWNVWQTFGGNSSSTNDYFNCNGLQTVVSVPLNIASFSPVQLIGFKYKFQFNDNGSAWGFCMGSPTIESRETAPCIAVSSLAADTTTITSTTAALTWTDNNVVDPANGWEIEYGDVGFVQGAGTTLITFSNPYTLTGLTADSCYDVYIRALCTAADISDWSPVMSFCTPIPGIECGGQYLDAGGANGDYANGVAAEVTTIYPINAGDVVSLVFTAFSMENLGTSCYDGLTIYDGNSTAAPTINPPNGGIEWCWDRNDATPSGSGDLQGMTITSTAADGSLTVVFSSDGSVSRPGWEANIFCAPPPTCFMAEDLAVDDASITITEATISWTDTNTDAGAPAGGWSIEWGPIGFVQGSGAGTGIAPYVATNPTYTITGLNPSTEYDFYVTALCDVIPGVDDSFWAGPASFITKCDVFTTPFTENFESNGNTPVCWEQDANNNEDWLFADDVTAPGNIGNAGNMGSTQTLSGGYFAWVEDSTPNNLNTALISPFITLVGVTAPTLGFYYASNDQFFNKRVDFSVDIWSDATSTWAEEVFTSSSDTNGWEQIFIDLAAFNGQVIQVRFVVDENSTSTRDDFAIDDIYVGEMPACINVNGITINDIANDNITLSWTDGGNIPTATTWEIEYGAPGFVQGTAAGIIELANTNNLFNLINLTSQTNYELYVRTDCGGGDYSLWAGPIQFTTLCDIFMAPFTEDFSDAGLLDPCWNQNNNFDPWKFSNNTSTPGNIGNAGDVSGTSTDSGGYFAYVDDSPAHTTNNTITTPLIDLTPLGGASIALSFYYISDNQGLNNVDFSVDIWDGTNWNIGLHTSSSNTVGWKKTYINMDNLTITGPVKARFRVDENNGTNDRDDLAIDDVTFDVAPACYPIYDAIAFNEDTTTMDISWTDDLNTAGIDYIIEYGTPGFAHGSGTEVTGVNTNPFTVTGLTPDTDYEFYVRAACTATDLGEWTLPVLGTTLPTCLTVTGVTGSAQTTSGFTVSWSDINTPAPVGGWDVEYVPATFPQGSGVTNTTPNPTYAITGLLPTTYYDVYVRANCATDDSDSSRWVGPITIRTAIGTPGNDLAQNAYTVPVGSTCEPFLGNNAGATQTGPTLLATDCADPAVDGLEPGFALDDVWFKFTMPASGTVIIQTQSANLTGVNTPFMVDSAISVYSGTWNNLEIIENANGHDVCNDDGNPYGTLDSTNDNNEFGVVQLHNQTALIGQDIFVRVWSVDQTNIGDGNVHGQFTICVFGNPVFVRPTSPLAVEDTISDKINLTYYPNPVENTLNLRATKNISAVRVYSILGQEVLQTKFTNSLKEVTIDLQNLDAGTYFIKVLADKKTETIKIIKK